MTSKALAKLGFDEDPLNPGWRTSGPLRVRLDGKTGTVVFIEVNVVASKGVCGDVPHNGCMTQFNLGATVTDCAAEGVRYVRAGPGSVLHRVEVFPPAVHTSLPNAAAECSVEVVPGQSAGPLRLGMTRPEVVGTGLPLDLFGGAGGPLVGDRYAVEFTGGPSDHVSAIRLKIGSDASVCLPEQQIDRAWVRGSLCSHGFCDCTEQVDPLAKGTAHAFCPTKGINFDFLANPPNELLELKVLPAVSKP